MSRNLLIYENKTSSVFVIILTHNDTFVIGLNIIVKRVFSWTMSYVNASSRKMNRDDLVNEEMFILMNYYIYIYMKFLVNIMSGLKC